MDVCPACAGTGKDKSSVRPSKLNSEPSKDGGASILVWAYGLLAALVMGVSSESLFDIWWSIGVFLGFGGGALGASFLVLFRIGRIILWLGVLAFIALVIISIQSGSS